MTIATDTARTGPYTGNSTTGSDGTSVFAYTFKAIDEAHLVVTVTTTASGVQVVKTLTTHFTVSGVGDEGGGNVTMVSGQHPLATETITISRDVTKSQPTDLVNRGAVQPETLETALDRGVQMVQDLDEIVDRSVRFAVSANLTSFSPDVPAPVASKVIAINAANTGFELVAEPSASVTAAAASASAAAISATAAAGEATSTAPKYTFSTTTSMADPGTGLLRYNHGTVASVTAIAVDDLTADTGNPDVEAWLKTFDDSTSTIKGWIRLVEPGTPANYAIFNVTAVADNSGWVQLTVVHVDSNGTFGDTDSIRLFFSRTGDKGTTGDTGPTGSTGAAGADGEVSEATSVALAIALG